MEHENGLVPIPILSNSAILWSGVLFLGLLITAISLELLRQSVARKRRTRAQWRTAAEIAEEKELSTDEWREIQSLIRRHAPEDPLRVMTVRQQFDTCVSEAMESLLKAGDSNRYQHYGTLYRDIRIRLALDYVPIGQRIHSTRELMNNQRIWIANASERPPTWFEMKVVNVDEAHLALERPDDAAPPRLNPGDTVLCRMWRDDDARYVFDMQFAERRSDPDAFLFVHNAKLERIQARQFYRVRHNQSATFAVITKSPDGDDSDAYTRNVTASVRGRITNLSAGGMALVVNQVVSKQVLLRTTLELAEAEPLTVVAAIVADSNLAGGRHLLRTTFVGLEHEDREKIARHVTIKQQHFEEAHLSAQAAP